jgi:hygromycin-B 7''-O-kinase
MQRPTFASHEEYSRNFTDVDYWQPYVENICQRHNLQPSHHIHRGLPGSNPVFIVDERNIVKIYTHLFGGAESYVKELELYSLFARYPQLPFPVLLASGNLFPTGNGWHWPYIVISVIPGINIGEVYAQLNHQENIALANYLGQVLYRLHNLPLDGLQAFKPSWDDFARYLDLQRNSCVENHRRWKALPDFLIDQINDYLLPVQTLIDQARSPLLLHCDLNQDHVLGFLKDGQWQTNGIIDFGDARVGDWHFELIALHLGLFYGDKTLLRAFLESYGIDKMGEAQFVHKAMTYTLLFEFDVLNPIFLDKPTLRSVNSLADLAERLWNTDNLQGTEPY